MDVSPSAWLLPRAALVRDLDFLATRIEHAVLYNNSCFDNESGKYENARVVTFAGLQYPRHS